MLRLSDAGDSHSVHSEWHDNSHAARKRAKPITGAGAGAEPGPEHGQGPGASAGQGQEQIKGKGKGKGEVRARVTRKVEGRR